MNCVSILGKSPTMNVLNHGRMGVQQDVPLTSIPWGDDGPAANFKNSEIAGLASESIKLVEDYARQLKTLDDRPQDQNTAPGNVELKELCTESQAQEADLPSWNDQLFSSCLAAGTDGSPSILTIINEDRTSVTSALLDNGGKVIALDATRQLGHMSFEKVKLVLDHSDGELRYLQFHGPDPFSLPPPDLATVLPGASGSVHAGNLVIDASTPKSNVRSMNL